MQLLVAPESIKILVDRKLTLPKMKFESAEIVLRTFSRRPEESGPNSYCEFAEFRGEPE